MGIRGLYTYCRDNKVTSSEENLVVIALTKSLTLHVDFISFKCLLKRTAIQMHDLVDKDVLTLVGSIYNIYQDLLITYLDCLKNCNIKVIFYVHRAAAANDRNVEKKLKQWKQEFLMFLEKQDKKFYLPNGQIPLTDNDEFRDILLENLIIKILKLKEYEIIYCSDEVEQDIGKQLGQTSNSFDVVLGRDTDFCLMKNINMIFSVEDMWDISKSLIKAYKNKSTSINELLVNIFTREKIANSFKVSVSQFVDAAIMTGNDFTSEFLSKEYCGLRNLKKICTAMKTSPYIHIDKVNHLKHILSNQAVRLALEKSRDFYELRNNESAEVNISPLGVYLNDKVRDSNLHKIVLNYHAGYHFCEKVIEDCEGPSIEYAIRKLIRLMSSMCLESNKTTIKAYGRSHHGKKDFEAIIFQKQNDLPCLLSVPDMTVNDCLNLFNKIFLYSEMEAENSEDLMSTYFGEISDPSKAMICYVFHFLVNIHEELKLTDKELSLFIITVVMVMNKNNISLSEYTFKNLYKWKSASNVKNLLRCLANINWFQMVIWYSNLLCEMLNMDSKFSLDAAVVFDGPLFANLYLENINEENLALVTCEILVLKASSPLANKRKKIWDFFCSVEEFIPKHLEEIEKSFK